MGDASSLNQEGGFARKSLNITTDPPHAHAEYRYYRDGSEFGNGRTPFIRLPVFL